MAGDPFVQLAQQVQAVRGGPAAASGAAQGAPAGGSAAAAADPFAQLAQQVQAAHATQPRTSTAAAVGAPWWKRALSGAEGVGETALQLATGTVAQPVAGLAGLEKLATGQGPAAAANEVGSLENALTYQPRTADGQAISHYAGLPFQALARGANYVGSKTADLTGSPLAGAAVNAGIQTIPLWLSAKLPALRDEAAAEPPVSDAVAMARAHGLKLTPTQAQVPGTFLGRLTESLMGHAKLERELSRANAPTVTRVAAEDVGIVPPKTPAAMRDAINDAYAPHRAVYDELTNLGPIPTDEDYTKALAEATKGRGFTANAAGPYTELRTQYSAPSFTGQQALEEIQSLRQEGGETAYSKRYAPAERALGKAKLKIANAIEEQINRHLNSLASGQPPAPDVEGFMRDFEQTAPPSDAEGSMRRVGSTHVALEPDAGVPGAVHVRLIESGDSPPIGAFGLRKLLALADAHRVPLTATALSGDDAIPTQTLAEHYQKVGFQPLDGSPQDGIRMRRQPGAARSAQADWARQAKDLIPRYRAARQAMARLSSFERAWSAGNGQSVSALNLARQLKNNVPLTGALRDVAESAQNFPRSFQELSKLRDNGPMSNLDFKFGTLAALLKPEILGAYLGPPAVRKLLGSDWYQGRTFGPFKEPLIPSFPSLGKAARGIPLLGLGLPQGRAK